MPIFEYQCKECQEIFESLQLSRATEEDTECPSCGCEATERVVSTFATSGGNGGFGADSSCGPSGSGFR
jgi:putative FmdB family regulatory protein